MILEGSDNRFPKQRPKNPLALPETTRHRRVQETQSRGMGFSLMVFISPQGPKSNKPDIAVERDKVHSKPTRMALGPCGTTVAFDVSVSCKLLGAGALHDEYSLS